MSNESPSHDSERFAAAFRQTFGKIGEHKARRILNMLLESPFFYREDDLDLFGLLRRRQSLFRDFFEAFFGWDLYVDDLVARLIKPVIMNPALRPSQRHVFHVSGRIQFVLFSLLLEFHQRQADEQNLDIEKEAEVRFVLADFVRFVFDRYRAESGSEAPSEQEILEAMRRLFKELERCRFIIERERQGIVENLGRAAGFTDEGMAHVLYALLPGLRCYRSEVLTRDDLFVRTATPEESSDEAATTETVDSVEGEGA